MADSGDKEKEMQKNDGDTQNAVSSKGTPERPYGRAVPHSARPVGSMPSRGTAGAASSGGAAGAARPQRPYGRAVPHSARPAGSMPSRGTAGAASSGGAAGAARPQRPYGKPGFARPALVRVAPQRPDQNPRYVALQVLQDIRTDDAYASLTLDEHLRKSSLSQIDTRLCTNLVYRTLENLIRIDFALSGFLQDSESLEKRVRDILRLGACQILFFDRVPANAIVDEAVKITRMIGLEALTGLTNAVLRGLIRGKESIAWPKPDEGARYLSIMFSVPMWLAEKLIEEYGAEQARQICAYRNESHAIVVRPNRMKLDADGLEKLLSKKVWNTEKAPVLDAFFVRGASDIVRDADYITGLFSIQGESSMLAAEAVCVQPGMQVLDACAAPGGKSACMAEKMQGTGRIYAWDIHDHRVALIHAMTHRLKLDNIRPAVRDATSFREDLEGALDAVLLDAPCTGLGVMDDKPDIRYRVSEESIAELTKTQEVLLNTCCRYVKKGGTLVYSTCSILKEENCEQITRFLSQHPEFKMAPLPNTFPESLLKRYGDEGLQIFPNEDHMEGFYIARMIRK